VSTITINNVKLVGTSMLVLCNPVLLLAAGADDDLSVTGRPFMEDELTSGIPLRDLRTGIIMVLRNSPGMRASIIPFVPESSDLCAELTGDFVKRKISAPFFRTHLKFPATIKSVHDLYLATYDDWECTISLLIGSSDDMSADTALNILTQVGANGVGISADGITAGIFDVDDSDIEVVEE